MDPPTTEIYTLSLHDALPIYGLDLQKSLGPEHTATDAVYPQPNRSEEHTSELQSRPHLVCRLLLEKKKKLKTRIDNKPGIRSYLTRDGDYLLPLHVPVQNASR